MSFEVAPEAYGRFMGRFSQPLAIQFVRMAELHGGESALDVGCGPGALTEQLIAVLGQSAVSAIDPSPPFVAAVRQRFPAVDVRSGFAEQLPFEDDCFDVALAQLVVHFMTDPVAGLAEMARVTKPGGLVAACVWDHAGGSGPLATFWQAARDLDPSVEDESDLPGAREGQLAELSKQAGLEVRQSRLTVTVQFPTFADWWEPFTLGVGPAGGLVARLDDRERARLAGRCKELLPPAPFEIAASAWTVQGCA
ncbi:MAG: class I SAM-dependent methyltransferase [Nocardioidaceae bacterium]